MSIRSWHISGIFLWCVWCFLALCVPLHSASAQKLLEQFSAAMPKVTAVPDTEFAAKTMLIESLPGGNAALAYRIKIPKDWKKEEALGGNARGNDSKVMQEVARYNGVFQGGIRPWLDMDIGTLEYNMTAQDWLVRHILEHGYGLQGMSVQSEKRAEAFYVYLKNDETYFVRSVVAVNGNHVLLVSYYIPSDLWEDEQGMQARVMPSVTVTAEDTPFKEHVTDYKFLDVAVASYPDLWIFKRIPGSSAERIKMMLIKEGREFDNGQYNLDGQVRMDMVSIGATKSLEKEFAQYKLDSQVGGMALGDLIEAPEDFILNPAFDFAQTEVYRVSNIADKVIDYEFWITAVSYKNNYFFVSLLTPSRDLNYFLWAQNKTEYKSMINSIRPQADMFETPPTENDSEGDEKAQAE